MRRGLSILVGSVLPLLPSAGQESVVARVGDEVITAGQFRDRFSTYLARTSDRDNIVVRKKIVENMIHETLIFRELNRTGRDASADAISRLQDITDQALLDAFARRLTTETLDVSDDELARAFIRSRSRAHVRFLYAPTRAQAESLRSRLMNGEQFARVARDVFEDPDLRATGGDLGFVGEGELEPQLEDIVFDIPVGVVSPVVRVRNGFGLVRVEQRVTLPLASESDLVGALPELRETVRARKTVLALRSAAARHESLLRPRYDRQGMQALLAAWKAGPSPGVTPPEYPGQSKTVVRFDGGSWSVSDVLVESHRTRQVHRARVRTYEDMQEFVGGLLARRNMLREARSLGLGDDPAVRKQIKDLWDQERLAMWSSMIGTETIPDPPDEEHLRNVFDDAGDLYVRPEEVRVAEIIVRTDSVARVVHRRLAEGDRFGSLAREFSIRRWAANRDGELGFSPRARFGDLAETIFSAQLGSVIGPVRTAGYIAFYHLQDRAPARRMTFDEARPEIEAAIASVRKQEMMQRSLEQLRSDVPIMMDVVTLSEIDIPARDGQADKGPAQ